MEWLGDFSQPENLGGTENTSDLRVACSFKIILISDTFGMTFKLSLSNVVGSKKYFCMSCWRNNRNTNPLKSA